MTELERDFTFSLTKYPSLIFVFLVVVKDTTVHNFFVGLSLIRKIFAYITDNTLDYLSKPSLKD